jgi:hypothetical protein
VIGELPSLIVMWIDLLLNGNILVEMMDSLPCSASEMKPILVKGPH